MANGAETIAAKTQVSIPTATNRHQIPVTPALKKRLPNQLRRESLQFSLKTKEKQRKPEKS